MTMGDLLYGKKDHRPPTYFQLRALTLEPETVHEVVARLRAEFPIVEVTRADPNSVLHSLEHFDMAHFDTAATWERQNLTISGMSAGQPNCSVTVNLNSAFPASVSANLYPGGPEATSTGTPVVDVAKDLARKIELESKPRLRWRPLLLPLPWIGWAATAFAWAWFIVANRPPASLSIAGALVVALLAISVARLTSDLETKYSLWSPGNWVRDTSRAQLREQRAQTSANVKVGLLVAAFTTPAGALITWLISK